MIRSGVVVDEVLHVSAAEPAVREGAVERRLLPGVVVYETVYGRNLHIKNTQNYKYTFIVNIVDLFAS
jgi:hypothetical protein